MTLSSKETSSSSVRNRDRAYSDGHALLENSSVAASADVTDTSVNKGHAPSNHKVATFKKQHHGNHHHHHNVHHQRPRSKSLDLHRHHSTPVHKKKLYPHAHKHIPNRTYSPQYLGVAGGGGRLSPSSSSNSAMMGVSPPRYHGKMWIRPATNTRSPAAPFLPSIESCSNIMDQKNDEADHNDYYDGSSTGFTSSFAPLMMDDPSISPGRQVTSSTTNSSTSPLVSHATSFDDDMLLQYNAATTYCASSPRSNNDPSPFDINDSSSFYEFRRQASEPQKPRLIFGESGKPIVRGKHHPTNQGTAFEPYVPAAAVL